MTALWPNDNSTFNFCVTFSKTYQTKQLKFSDLWLSSEGDETRKLDIRIRICNIRWLLFEYSNIFVLH